MIDPSDGSTSDESVLYQGVWLAFDDANRTTLQSQIEEQRLEYSIELARLNKQINILKNTIKALTTSAEEDTLVIQALQNSNEELTNQVAELTGDLKSTTIELMNRRAKEAQALSIRQIQKKQQIDAIKNRAEVAQTKSSRQAFFRAAARNLQNFSIGRNRVSFIKDDFFRNRNRL